MQVYCDGSYMPATGVGGWGVVVMERLRQGLGGVLSEAGGRVQAGGSSLRMEVEAVLQALRLLRTEWLQLDEVVIASDVQALIEALVRQSREDPLTGIVLLEHPDLLEKLERWPDWGAAVGVGAVAQGQRAPQPGSRDRLSHGVEGVQGARRDSAFDGGAGVVVHVVGVEIPPPGSYYPLQR